jgi:GNAT superfamily N-acetyltransferase
MHIHPVNTAADWQAFHAFSANPTAAAVAQQQPDVSWVAWAAEGQAVARASLWWTHAPPYAAACVGCIGHYAATHAEGAVTLLKAACAQLAAAGCTLAVGPLDGNTFRAYRLVTQRSLHDLSLPPFFLEPDTPADWPAHWRAAGFTPFAEYVSARAVLTGPDPRLDAAQWRLDAHGITVRSLRLEDFDRELQRLYPVVMAAFAHAPLFAPITEAEFLAQYAPLRAYVQPELVALAEQGAELVGFLLAVPDLAQAQRGQAVDTVVLKTLAVLPGVGGVGLGTHLAAFVHTRAHALGYRYAIHALMHEANRSRHISEFNAVPFRGYTLFARALT